MSRTLARSETVRTFDHSHIATLNAYPQLRRALSDLCNQAAEHDGMNLPDLLASLADMAATAPYGDMCTQCRAEAASIWWPHAITRNGNSITGTYRCGTGHSWTCNWAISTEVNR